MSEDEEPAGKGRRRRSDIWGGVLRVDCTDLPAAQARQWLSDYRDVVEKHIVWFRRSLHHTVGLVDEDLRTVGQMAVLEACRTYNDTSGATLRTWVGTVVRWRLTSLLHKLSKPQGEHVNHMEAVTRYEASQVDEFEERMEYTEQLRQLAAYLAMMPHRTRIVLFQRLEGVDERTIAKTLGISKVRTEQLVGDARAQLREALVSEGCATSGGTAFLPT